VKPDKAFLILFIRRLQEEISRRCRDVECAVNVLEEYKLLLEEVGAEEVLSMLFR